MNAIEKVRRLIESKPTSPLATTLARLVRALESNGSFQIVDLYDLDFEHFNLAIEMLKEWRLDRYLLSKVKLHHLAAFCRQHHSQISC